MINIYKKMWEKFKVKYGEEYIIFEGGDSVENAMDEFEEEYLKELKEYNEYIKTFKAGYGEKPITSRPKPKPKPKPYKY